MRLIDADALLKGKRDHEMISTHEIYNAPTIERTGKWEPLIQIEVEMPRIVDAVIQQLTKDGTLVEVVRCGECKRWERNFPNKFGQCFCPLYGGVLPSEFYCAYGERRTDEAN